jgi:transcriptional regulator with XRE-family HTH domain
MHPLRAHRLNRGWSLEDLAAEIVRLGEAVGEPSLGLIGPTVGRWERGERRPRPPYPKLLCLLFQASASDLGIAGSAPTPSCAKLDDVERRTMLRLLAGALASPVLVQAKAETAQLAESKADRLAHALRKPSRADEAVVSTIETAIAAARRLDDVSGSRVAVRAALAQQEVIKTLLDGGTSEGLRARLTMAAAELSQLLGWLAFDMNDHRTSRSYLDEALRLAHEAGAESLGAYMLGHRSVIEVRENRPHEGLVFAEAAKGRVEGKGSPATQSWLAIAEARAMAELRDRTGAERALDRARTSFAQFSADDEPAWMYY